MSEMEAEVIVLEDEDGNEIEFEIVDVFEMKERKYAVLIPCDEDEDSEEEIAVFLRIGFDKDGEDILEDLDDDEFEEVAKFYEEMIAEEDDSDE